MSMKPFSTKLQEKITRFKAKQEEINLGSIKFNSRLILAPMAGICTPPFRLLMEDLGAGGTVSELVSCHGINYANEKTLEMLKIDEREKNVGIQLFGDDKDSMAKAAIVAETYGPKFIDINMGCPVKKVVTKGGGSALLKEIESLGPFFKTIKKAIKIPLSIKIRTGWDADDINADKIAKIAYDEGVEWIAIHGRTRAQQYTGAANWDYIEWLSKEITLPLIGNGDLHEAHQISARLKKTNCKALMIARGSLRNPFAFLEGLDSDGDLSSFFGEDYFEVIERLYQYTCDAYSFERARFIQMRKLVVWFAAGFPNAKNFRDQMFKAKTLDEVMKASSEYFLGLGIRRKKINYEEAFMNAGHG